MLTFASWSTLTVDFMIVIHLSMAGVALSALLHLVHAKWRYDIRYFAVSFFSLYPLAVILMIILLFGGKMTFPWVTSLQPKPLWNNLGFLAVRQLLGISIVGVVFSTFIRWQKVSEETPENWARFKKIAAAVPFVYIIYVTMLAWDFEMTQIPYWESSMYSVNHIVSHCGFFMSVLAVSVFVLEKAGLLVRFPGNYIYNFISQMMLGFTILWVYTFFGQYLIIWYGNIPEETGRIFGMQDGSYGVLFWSFIVMKFFIPFPVLAMRPSRFSPKIIVAVACCIILGTWIERFTWISGSYPSDHFPMTSFFEVAVTVVIAFIGFTLVRARLKANQIIK